MSPHPRRWSSLVASAGLCLALTGCGGGEANTAQADTGNAGPGAAALVPDPPAGWRWESFRDAMVAVPAEWRWGGSSRISQWCASSPTKPQPMVGRPGPSTAVGCPDGKKGEADPGSLVRNGGTYVALVGAANPDLRDEGDRVVVRTDLAAVVIQAERALREQIAATVRTIATVDHNGCTLTHPLAQDPAWRPTPTDLPTVRDVTSIAACKYDFADPTGENRPASGPLLVSSQALTDDAATRTFAALVAAPAGGGPDNPGSCLAKYSYGDEAILLRILRSSGDPIEVVMRYSGCDHNGFDDGALVRRLTPESGTALVDGANFVSGYSGTADKTAVLHPASAASAREKEQAGRR